MQINKKTKIYEKRSQTVLSLIQIRLYSFIKDLCKKYNLDLEEFSIISQRFYLKRYYSDDDSTLITYSGYPLVVIEPGENKEYIKKEIKNSLINLDFIKVRIEFRLKKL